MYENNFPSKRYKYTPAFPGKHIVTNGSIPDFGIENPFPEVMRSEGYTAENTGGVEPGLDISAGGKIGERSLLRSIPSGYYAEWLKSHDK